MGGEHAETHLLPSPQSHDAARVQIGSDEGVKFDALGPLVVNSDGTLSRIANWPTMTEPERERTMRVLVARNKIRIADQEKKQEAGTESTP